MVCRQQQSLDVRLERAGGAPWGFRLVGGADFDLPLTVVKVEVGSAAARGGLADGDTVVSVGGVAARSLTQEAAHQLIVAAGQRIHLAVIRGTSPCQTQAPPGFSPIPTIDMVPPYQPEVPPHDRSLTSSPFLLPAKPFRPFSTEPVDGVPPVEKPIILSPFYNDNFAKIKKKNFEEPTRFKLEISKYYVADNEEMNVAESYSNAQTAQLTSMEELNKELDLEQIENTAAFVVDVSLNKAVTVTKEIKQEIDYELRQSEEMKSIKEISEIISGKTVDATKLSASLLAQLIDQTADEISKSNTVTETSNIKVESSKVEMAKAELNTLESVSNETVSIQNTKEQSSVEKSSEYREDRQEKHQFEKSEKSLAKSHQSISESHILSEANQSLEVHSKSSEHFNENVNRKTSEENIQQSHTYVEEKMGKATKKDVSESRKEITTENNEGSKQSLTDIKQQTISTANLLAEQRSYTLGLQTIPNIQGHVQSSYHYDLLLKTFFIHLTDVMVALSRIILTEGGSRSNSPMPPQKSEDTKRQVSQEIITQKTTQEQTSTETKEHVEKTQVQVGTKKTSSAKFAQLAQLKTEEMTQKMDAVISEFKKDVGEQAPIQENVEIDRNARGKSISKIEEEVLKEKDPLEWLAKVDESKSISISKDEISITQEIKDSSTYEMDAEELKGKIIYVATVEAHQVSNMEGMESSLTREAIAETTVEETAEKEFSTETCEKTNNIDEIKNEVRSEVIQEQKLSQEQTEMIQESSVSITQEAIEATQICKSSQESTIMQETSISKEKTQSISAVETKLESTMHESTFESAVAVEQQSNYSTALVEDRLESKTSISPPQSVKSETIGSTEPVRTSELQSQVSVTSEDSYTAVPQTPLTDEYVFRLQIHLDESKNPIPLSPPVEHEDPYTVKKPKLIPHIETSIESVKYVDDSQKEQEPLKTNGTEAFPGKIDRITETASSENAIEGIAPDTNSKDKTDSDVTKPGTVDATAPPVLKMSQSIASVAETATNIAETASYASNTNTSQTFATNIGTRSTDTTHGIRRVSATLVEDTPVQDTMYEERRKSVILTSAIDNTIKSIEKYKQDVGIDAHRNEQQYVASLEDTNSYTALNSFVKYNCGLVTKHYGVVTHHGGVVKRDVSQDGGPFAQNGGLIANGCLVDGTTQGIVDSLENAGILDSEVARQLGKPGLTEQKVAQLISGESDMMKEAHVIGLKRVIASHMNRLNDDDDSEDLKKIKPQIEALKDSEVLRALNEELTRTKEEKKKEERKWTKFLQRPDRAVPPRPGYPGFPVTPTEPYKILIVKQPKPKVAPDYKPQDFETGPLPWESQAANEPRPPPAPREEPVLVPEEDPEYLEALDNLPESEVPDLEDTGIVLPTETIPAASEPATPPSSPTDQQPAETEPLQVDEPEAEATDHPEELTGEEMEKSQLVENVLCSIQSMVDPGASMEEQLVQMRAQLAALAQLPCVISQTLELVTNQLGQLTRPEKEEVEPCESTVAELREERIDATTPELAAEECTDQVKTEPSPLPNGTDLVNAEQASLPNGTEQPESQPPAPFPVPPELDKGGQDPAAEDEHNRIERQKKELMAELQMEHEQRQVKQRPTPRVASARPRPAFGPRVPQERPLVLPGGRRWHNAKDAHNEDFIRETLAAQAELIQGKTKGINFSKWEKPAKSMDFLKDSDVYKLVHNMGVEIGRQIDYLPPVAIAESEYREISHIREILQDHEAVQQPRDCPAKCLTALQVYGGAAKCPQVCATSKCPQACGGVLPQVCQGLSKRVSFALQSECAAPMVTEQSIAPIVTELSMEPMVAKLSIAPMMTELSMAPMVTEPAVAPMPPRPLSRAEAIEIITNYVESYAYAESRTTPAVH